MPTLFHLNDVHRLANRQRSLQSKHPGRIGDAFRAQARLAEPSSNNRLKIVRGYLGVPETKRPDAQKAMTLTVSRANPIVPYRSALQACWNMSILLLAIHIYPKLL